MSEFNYTEWMQQNKVGPYKKYSLRENGIGDVPDNSKLPGNPKLQAAVKYLVQNRDKYITQDYFSKHSISFLSSKSDKELYDYIISKMHSDDVYDTVANMRSQMEKDMYANTDPNIADPIKESHPGNDKWYEEFQTAISAMGLAGEAEAKVMKALDHTDPITQYGFMTAPEAARDFVSDLGIVAADDYGDYDADYEEPRDDFEMAGGDFNDGEFWEGEESGIDEAGNVKGIVIEIPGNSSAVDFGKAAARELVESFGARDFKYFLQAFTQEISKLTSR